MPRRSAVLVTTSALVAVAVAVAALLVVRERSAERDRDDAARAAATALATAWSAGDLSGARFTGTTGADAQARYAAVVAGLGDQRPTVAVTGVARTGDTATASLDVTWAGVAGWRYTSTAALAPLVAGDDQGAASWGAALTPSLLAPGLADGEVLDRVRTQPPRAAVLARDGSPLVVDTPVVQVGVQPSRTTDPDGLARDVAALTGVDAAALAARVRAAAASDALVPVITLREPDYAAVRDRLQPLPGTVFSRAVLPLAPTATFARPLLGSVGAATADAVDAGGGRVAAGDTTGLGGLQQQYDERLAGTPGTTVRAVPAPAAGAGAQAAPRTLFTAQPTTGEPLRLSLDARVQRAAEAALATARSNDAVPAAALVAVDVPTGDLLAVADAPSYGVERALTGQYPPGSTFKVITTTALLGDGVTPESVVPCTATTTVDGRAFRNFEGEAFGAVPFRTDFAQSCNTAFISASSRLADDDLQRAAASLGVGGGWDLGTPAQTGSVPAEGSAVDRAAASIGQGTVLASPVAMAVAAATVARGSWTAPRLVLDPAPTGVAAAAEPAPDAGRLAVVRDLMRSVVTDGTASALADVPGAPVIAKTGTAEYGSQDPPQVHAWVVGAQGDTAFAVLVEDGTSGATTAVPVAEAFLRALA